MTPIAAYRGRYDEPLPKRRKPSKASRAAIKSSSAQASAVERTEDWQKRPTGRSARVLAAIAIRRAVEVLELDKVAGAGDWNAAIELAAMRFRALANAIEAE